MLKKICAVILSFVMIFSVCGMIPVAEADAAFASSTAPKNVLKGLDSLRKKFPDGKYWNHYGSNKINLNGWTNTPCPSGHYLNGKQQCNGQCDGFARKLGTDLFGLDSYKWKNVKYDPKTLCVGDIIRYGNRHTIFVVGFTPDEGTIIVADCNWDYHCGISWDRYFDISSRSINWVLRYPGNNFNRDTYLNLPLESIKLEYSDYVVPMGRNVVINYTLSPKLVGLEESDKIVWTSSDPSVATVNTFGYINPIKPGKVKLTASCNGVSASCNVTVTDYIGIRRLYGSNRIETAISISDHFNVYDESTNNVIIANGFEFADALAGVPLSAALEAPILLTKGKTLEPSVKEQLKYLKTTNIYILGGNAAVSADIEKELTDSGYTVERLYGKSRFETSVVIAEKLSELCGAPTEAFLANGMSFADALSVGPVAAAGNSPILYVRPSGEIDAATGEFIANYGIRDVVVLGGTGAVSDDIGHSLSTYSVASFERISGKDRYVTCIKILDRYADRFADTGIMALATGAAFPDALAGGAFASNAGFPLLLTNKNISDSAKEWLSEQEIDFIYVFGGEAAVSNRTVFQYSVK